MPILTTENLAGEIGLIMRNVLNAKLRKLMGGDEELFEYIHEEDIEDLMIEASDLAADLVKEKLCTFATPHPNPCQLCA